MSEYKPQDERRRVRLRCRLNSSLLCLLVQPASCPFAYPRGVRKHTLLKGGVIHALLGQTVVASGASTYIAADQLTAINLAATVDPDHKATVIPRFPAWPSITKYVNDNGGFSDVVPEYIWDSTTTDNQVRAFAALSGGVGSQVSPVTMSVSLTVFADNAHIARIDVYDFSGSSPLLSKP